MRANYLLIIDNLLDLTHSGYLHVNSISVPASLRPPESTSGVDVSGIFSRFLTREVPASGQFREIWGEAPCDYHRESRWTAPSLIYTIIGCAPVGKPLSEGIYGDGRHLLTPETDLTTHYFYTATRYANLEPAHDAEILKLVEQAFLYEDEPMIAACQAYMGSHDLFDLDPIILPTDRASVLARRTIARMMTDELNPKLSEPEPV
jgi:vanillate O-demethylase monooxygenase subunit